MRTAQSVATRARWRPPRAPVDRKVLIAVAAGIVAAIIVAPAGWKWPAVCGVLVGGATLALALNRRDRAGRLAASVIGGLLVVAAVTLWQVPSRAYGVAVLALVVALYPAARLAESWGEADTRRRQIRGFLRGFATGAVIAVAALVILGLYERHQASFAMRYGQPVTVTVAQSCAGQAGGSCDGSTWTIDGNTYIGRLLLGDNELARSPKQAYTVAGDFRAYTDRHYTASIDGLEIFGFVPTWLVWPILILMVLVALPARLWRRIRPAASPASSAASPRA